MINIDMDKLKPMLAVKAEIAEIKFPCYASLKLDGIRALIVEDGVLSRNLLSIPNNHIQEILGSNPDLIGLDGELIVGEANSKTVFAKTTSGVMSEDGCPNFTFWVFDYFSGTAKETPFKQRIENLTDWFAHHAGAVLPHVKLLPQIYIENAEQLEKFETEALAMGYEGVIVRSVDGLYKFGRSTLRQGWMLKLKRFEDAEAEIIGYEELLSNQNEQTIDNLGNSKRSSHKENMIPMEVLGSLRVKDCKTGIEFNIGSGFTALQRAQYWADLTGKPAIYSYIQDDQLVSETIQPSGIDYIKNFLVTYKHFPIGVVDAPRFPTFKGFRSKKDC